MRTRSLAPGPTGRRALDAVADLLGESVDACDMLVCIAGLRDGAVTYVSAPTADRLGSPPRELVGRPLAELVEPDAREDVAAILASGTDVDHAYVPLIDAGGRAVPVECRIAFKGRRFLLLGDARRAAYGGREGELLELNDELVVMAREGSRLARRLEGRVHELEAELEASADELHVSFRRSMRARDEERRRILRDLHDGAQQQLLAVGVGLDLAADSLDEPAIRARLVALRRQLDDALTVLRNTARGIYPAALAEHGMAEGIRAATLASVPPVALRAETLRRYPAEIEGAVYFSCIEAIQNAVKHAQAQQIVVELAEAEGELLFSVRDDGCGFDPRQSRPGAGLRNIADRVRAAGGHLRVSSALGGGTTLSGRVPTGEPQPGP